MQQWQLKPARLQKTEKETIWIRGAITGRLKTLVAKKSANKNEKTERSKPEATSKISPEGYASNFIKSILSAILSREAYHC
jgi:hypothetical protein